mmetsp:Transcript_4928/g.13765  ORF Transcript_4928/g.13765 Transcript_4928/m.13765 type:complete len:633 (-) Transcript_4928:1644-3542(-)
MASPLPVARQPLTPPRRFLSKQGLWILLGLSTLFVLLQQLDQGKHGRLHFWDEGTNLDRLTFPTFGHGGANTSVESEISSLMRIINENQATLPLEQQPFMVQKPAPLRPVSAVARTHPLQQPAWRDLVPVAQASQQNVSSAGLIGSRFTAPSTKRRHVDIIKGGPVPGLVTSRLSSAAVSANPFSGVSDEELENEQRLLSSAAEAYRSGDYKKHKAAVTAYRHALHKLKRAKELRKRPYPPEPIAPNIKLPELPTTHSLAAKCFASDSNSRRKARLTIMNKEAYKPGDNIVTWVRTVGLVSQDFWEALPATDPFAGVTYRTCAVVASAGLLRNRRFGAQIDAHDAVFRFNSAYTAGMEEHVGSKSTVRLMNRENFGFMGGPEEIVLQHITTEAMMADFVAFRRMFPATKLFAIHPAFYNRVITEDADHPSNGYFGMRLALELCDCVRLYGFIRSWQGYMTYHYHDDYTPRKSQHSRDSSELPLIKALLNDHLGRLAFAHPCILSQRCEGCPDKAAKCHSEVPYPVPTPGHCYGHGPPGGYPTLNPWEPGKFWPEGLPDQGGSLAKARERYQPAKDNMNEQKPFLPFADERRSCFRQCLSSDHCPGGVGGVCPEPTANAQPCLLWRDVSPPLQ